MLTHFPSLGRRSPWKKASKCRHQSRLRFCFRIEKDGQCCDCRSVLNLWAKVGRWPRWPSGAYFWSLVVSSGQVLNGVYNKNNVFFFLERSVCCCEGGVPDPMWFVWGDETGARWCWVVGSDGRCRRSIRRRTLLTHSLRTLLLSEL